MKIIITGILALIFLQFSSTEDKSRGIKNIEAEEVNYTLKYGIFKIGEAQVKLTYDDKCRGALIIADAKSTGIFKFIKNVHFRYECCMDTATGLPQTDSRILIEGEYADISTVYYDHLSRMDSSLVYSEKTGTLVVPKNIYDLLSGFYRYRTYYLRNNLPLHYTVKTTTFFIDKVWDLTITYYGKETIRTVYGPMECIVVKPVTVIGHFFRTSDAMTIWFADKGKYIPVKFSLDMKVGTLYGDITPLKE